MKVENPHFIKYPYACGRRLSLMAKLGETKERKKKSGTSKHCPDVLMVSTTSFKSY